MMRMMTVAALAVASGALLMSACSPGADAKCPKFAVGSEVGKNGPGTVTFTLTPTHDGLTYNWSVSAGSITEGQGTAAIVVNDPTAGETVTATVEVGGLDASCPAGSNVGSASATMP